MNKKMMDSRIAKRMLTAFTVLMLAAGMTACGSSGNQADSEDQITATVAAENTASGAQEETGASGTASESEKSTSGSPSADEASEDKAAAVEVVITPAPEFEGTSIVLSDDGILVDGEAIGTDSSAAVYAGEDIVYYEEGKDDTYGEGSEDEAHSAEEAAAHTVVTITKAGSYELSGKLSKGQIAIDLGSDAKEDESAVVNLYLNNADITCTVAPAIVAVKAYECGDKDTANATPTVNTEKAGFNLILTDNSVNTINGSHVAKIYEEGTTDKKYKYDAALESKVSFNICGGELSNGILTVNADNEGIESGCHLTINGGEIIVNSDDDAINTNEDGVSVLTINGGIITCDSGGGTEGDGIDSNGYVVINGGYTIACANAASQDSGLDSDLGIYINGGTVLATGNMYDEVTKDSAQTFMVLNFSDRISQDSMILIKDASGNAVKAFSAVNDYTMLVYSSPDLVEGDYTLYEASDVQGEQNGSIYTNITSYTEIAQLQHTPGGMRGGFGGGMSGKGTRPEMPADGAKPEDGTVPEMPADGAKPEDGTRPEMPADGTMPEDGTVPEMPADGMMPEDGAVPEMPADGTMPEDGTVPEMPADGTMPEDGTTDGETGNMQRGGERGQGGPGRGGFGQAQTSGDPTTTFSLTADSYTFSNITRVTGE